MNTTFEIRQHFRPIQPSVKAGKGKVSYQEFQPAPQLQDLIHCYWQLQTHELLEAPFSYRVVSDGCIDIFFNLNQTDENFVMGFCKKFTQFPIGQEFNYAGIRFYPSIFPTLFQVSAQTLKDKDQPLINILLPLAKFISNEISIDFNQSMKKLDDFFISKIQENPLNIDERFYEALLQICKKNGHLEVESELNVGVSARQLRRLFNFYIGTTPKSFSQVVRFQYILNAKPSTQSLKENKIFYDVGFFDQAHFIKNFTKFYGVTPSKAFE